MPVRTWEASWGLEKGWEPRSRSRRGGCPLAAESTREEELSEAVGGGQRSRSPLFSGWGRQEGEDDFLLACSGEQVYPHEQVGFPLVPGAP